jgi:FkbM family methyltransferase
MYSQNNEQEIITEYFAGRVGKFIDIGAFNAFQFSNTRALYEAGWYGVMVEPVAKLADGIKEVYKDEPRIEVLQLAIGLSNEPLTLHVCEDAVSTTNVDWRNTWAEAGVQYTEQTVPQMHIVDFLLQYGKDVKFISIDTEKTNIELFRAIPDWFFRQIEMLCIEHDGLDKEVEMAMQPFGFKRVLFNAENIILAK